MRTWIGVMSSGVEKHIANAWFSSQLNNLQLLVDLSETCVIMQSYLGNWEDTSSPVISCSGTWTHHDEVIMCEPVCQWELVSCLSRSIITLFCEWKQGVCGRLLLRLRSHKYINTKIERSNFLLGICVFSHFLTCAVISCACVHGWHFILPIQISHDSIALVMWFIFSSDLQLV